MQDSKTNKLKYSKVKSIPIISRTKPYAPTSTRFGSYHISSITILTYFYILIHYFVFSASNINIIGLISEVGYTNLLTSSFLLYSNPLLIILFYYTDKASVDSMNNEKGHSSLLSMKHQNIGNLGLLSSSRLLFLHSLSLSN